MNTVIVGIGPGLGTALARRFAAGGHSVSLVARSAGAAAQVAAELQAAGGQASGYRGDASSIDSMQYVFGRIRDARGHIDNLVFNVAMITPDRFLTPSAKSHLSYGERWATRGGAISINAFMETLQTNVASALICAKQVAEAMQARRAGTILVTGGTLGLAPWVEWGSLSVGKAALRSLTRSLFQELRSFDVHAALVTIHDTIAPGTPYAPDLIADFYWDIMMAAPETWVAEYDFNPTDAVAVDRDLVESTYQ